MVKNAKQHHEKFSIGVKALIVKNGQLLFLKRRDFPTWELPGGRINQGEKIRDALARELKEELPQLKIHKIHGIVHADQADFTLPNGNSLMLLFFVVTGDAPDEINISDEHEQARWVKTEELPGLDTKPHFRQAALAALQRTSLFA